MHGYLKTLQLRRMCAADGAAHGRMNLQLFAGSGGAGDNGSGSDDGSSDQSGGESQNSGKNKSGVNTSNNQSGEKMLSQSEVNHIVQETIARERKKAEDARTEAEKLAKMTEQQRMQHEIEKQKEELTRRETDLNRRELRAAAAETLAQKNLPNALLDILDYSSAEACNKSIEAHETAWSRAVQAGVEDRLKAKPPKRGGSTDADTETIRKAAGLPSKTK